MDLTWFEFLLIRDLQERETKCTVVRAMPAILHEHQCLSCDAEFSFTAKSSLSRWSNHRSDATRRDMRSHSFSTSLSHEPVRPSLYSSPYSYLVGALCCRAACCVWCATRTRSRSWRAVRTHPTRTRCSTRSASSPPSASSKTGAPFVQLWNQFQVGATGTVLCTVSDISMCADTALGVMLLLPLAL